ncbi:MAG: peptide chain release factor N(5)-glutamine methyltransferase [Sedimenticola sp.]|nr:peptide chain release factor N(5)-glutamine methyltransferase [Sedimenticola sp.]
MSAEKPLEIAEVLRHAVTSATVSRLEAEVLLMHILNKPRSFLFAWPEYKLTPEQRDVFLEQITRHQQGEPVAYITGSREFWSLSLKVTPATLIPRPETEHLVERALTLLQSINSASIADLGTGSGAIAAALGSELPDSIILATDQSEEALSVARINFKNLGLKNIRALQGNWLNALPSSALFDLIISNPPYVAEQDPHLLQGGLPWEPNSALIAGTDGLDDIRHLINAAPAHLNTQGWLILEHGYEQGEAVRALFSTAGYREITTHQDLEQRDRLTEGRKPREDSLL